jgi:hypothetical protein
MAVGVVLPSFLRIGEDSIGLGDLPELFRRDGLEQYPIRLDHADGAILTGR